MAEEQNYTIYSRTGEPLIVIPGKEWAEGIARDLNGNGLEEFGVRPSKPDELRNYRK